MKRIFEILKLNKKSKGSLTVEAAMIFPLIMFVMFAIIYLTIVHYQNNVMIAESIRAMNRAGAYYQYIDMDGFGSYGKPEVKGIVNSLPFDNDIPADGIINIDMIKNRNMYRTVIDLFAEKTRIGEMVAGSISDFFNIPIGAKNENATKYVDSRIAGVKFKQYIKTEAKATKVEGNGVMFVGSGLKTNMSRYYINPLQGLSNVFFGKNQGIMENIKTKSIKEVSGVISNQAEFIRNLDTIYDIGVSLINEFRLHKAE